MSTHVTIGPASRTSVAAGVQDVRPSFVARVARATSFRLAPEHRAPSDVNASLVRFADWLKDDGFSTAVVGTQMYAAKHTGVRYRNLSPVERGSRGFVACWFDGTRLHLEFRPDWLAAFIDVGLIALLFGVTRTLASPVVDGFHWDEAAFAFLINLAVLPTLKPLMRARFYVLLARAVWANDQSWARVRWRAGIWRWAWIIGTVVAMYPAAARLGAFLALVVRSSWLIDRTLHIHAGFAVVLGLWSVLAIAGMYAISYVLMPNHNNRTRD